MTPLHLRTHSSSGRSTSPPVGRSRSPTGASSPPHRVGSGRSCRFPTLPTPTSPRAALRTISPRNGYTAGISTPSSRLPPAHRSPTPRPGPGTAGTPRRQPSKGATPYVMGSARSGSRSLQRRTVVGRARFGWGCHWPRKLAHRQCRYSLGCTSWLIQITWDSWTLMLETLVVRSCFPSRKTSPGWIGGDLVIMPLPLAPVFRPYRELTASPQVLR